MSNVQIHRRGRVGIIALDRPRALNALTFDMVNDIDAALSAFLHAPAVERVLLTSTSPKAFCAGGDIRRIQQHATAGEVREAMEFFLTEYPVNLSISRYPKPFISLIDGMCMGGGMGLSVHGRYRVVTERASFAMPETLIGFFPDIGGTYFLPRLPDRVGICLGLTGMRIPAGDAVRVGLATHFVLSEALPALTEELCSSPASVGDILDTFAHAPPVGLFEENRARIARCFGKLSVGEIVCALKKESTSWCDQALEALSRASPSSLDITFDLLNWGHGQSLPSCLDRELAFAEAFIQSPDFAEGVRAALIDKDQSPRWSPENADVIAKNLRLRRYSDPMFEGMSR